MPIYSLDDLDLTPPDNYADLQIWLKRNLEIIQQMSNRDFFIEVNKGNVPGHSLIRKFGSNNAVAATLTDVWEGGADLVFLTVADTIDVYSDNVADTDVTGANAWAVKLTGCDMEFNRIDETVRLNGLTHAVTTQEFHRVWRAKVVETGSIGTRNGGAANLGNIILEGTTLNNIQAYITAGEGQTSGSHFVVDAGKIGFLISLEITMDTGKTINVDLVKREGAEIVSAPFPAHRHIKHWKGLDQPIITELHRGTPEFLEKTDIWFEAQLTGGGTAVVDVEYTILLVDVEFLGPYKGSI